MLALFKKIISFILSIFSIFTFGLFGANSKFEPMDKNNIKLNFAAIADVHMEEGNVARQKLLEMGLCDCQNSKSVLDSLVLIGDSTDSGQPEQYKMLENAFSKYTPSKNIIMVEGNHDTHTEENNYPAALSLFIDYNKKIAGRDIDKPYYSTVINGYTFIVLGSETDWSIFAYISDEQIEWLSNEMEKASQKGLPIFVFTHWPFNQTHGLPDVWGDYDDVDEGGFGYQSDAIENILKKYKNVFMISGHLHSGFTGESDNNGYHSIENDGSFHSINIPCYSEETWQGKNSTGTGCTVEVYGDKVLVRARNFANGKWYPDYTYSITIE